MNITAPDLSLAAPHGHRPRSAVRAAKAGIVLVGADRAELDW